MCNSLILQEEYKTSQQRAPDLLCVFVWRERETIVLEFELQQAKVVLAFQYLMLVLVRFVSCAWNKSWTKQGALLRS